MLTASSPTFHTSALTPAAADAARAAARFTDPAATQILRAPSCLPAELRELSSGELIRRLGRHDRLGAASWSSQYRGRGRFHLEATIRLDGTAHRCAMESTGTIAGLSAMLAELGLGVEITTFRSRHAEDGRTAIFIGWTKAGTGREQWSLGYGPDKDTASIHALLAAAQSAHL